MLIVQVVKEVPLLATIIETVKIQPPITSLLATIIGRNLKNPVG
jgi:hypothetical protein